MAGQFDRRTAAVFGSVRKYKLSQTKEEKLRLVQQVRGEG